MTVMEVGGAYAHIFFELLEFLELQFLVITDLDSVAIAGGTACAVHQGTATSNACLNTWFANEGVSLPALLGKGDAEKVRGQKRIAFQRPEAANGPCGRTFEDAFMLANQNIFTIAGATSNELELNALEEVKKIKKSQFALRHAIHEPNWVPPGYITDGIKWLAEGDAPNGGAGLPVAAGAAAEPTAIVGAAQ